MQKSTWLGLIVVVVIGLALFFARKDSYPQFAQTKLNQPITGIEFQPCASGQQVSSMVRIKDTETLQRVGDWLKTLTKAEFLSAGNDPVCPMILYMADGTTLSMKISPTVLKFSGIKIADPVNTILVSWNGYLRSGDNVFQDFLNHHRFRRPAKNESNRR